MKTLFIVVAISIFQLGAAQKTTQLKSFNTLAVSGNIELTLIKSSDNKIVVNNGRSEDLKISSEEGSLALSAQSGSTVEAVLYYNGPIESIAASGGVEITGKDVIKASICSISAAAGCELSLTVDVDKLTTAVASGSEVSISGSAKSHNAAVASGAELNAQKLTTGDTVATIASGAEASVNSKNTVTATVARGAELNIYGHPKKVDEVKAEGAEINIIQ